MTKTIELSNGGCAIVDDKDFEYLSQWRAQIQFRGEYFRIGVFNTPEEANKAREEYILYRRL